MKLLKVLTWAILIVIISSCISNHRIVYLQDHSLSHSWDRTVDTSFATPSNSYTLEPKDIIYVKSEHIDITPGTSTVTSNDEDENRATLAVPMLAGYTINDSGFVNLPVLGSIKLAGLTLLQAQDTIQAISSQYFKDPALRLFMLNNFVTVLGEVNHPGRFPVYDKKLNIFAALGMAGNATDFANREAVKIVRSRHGKTEIKYIDLTSQSILTSPYYFIQPGDIIMVKPQKRKKYATRDVQNVFNAVAAIVSVITLYLLIQK